MNMCTVCMSDGCSEVVTYVFPSRPRPVSPAGKQEAKCNGVKERDPEDEKRCAAAVRARCLLSAETDTRAKDINSAGDANEK